MLYVSLRLRKLCPKKCTKRSIGVNPLVSTVSGHPQFLEGKEEREEVGGREKGRKEGGHSLIFTWIDATETKSFCH